jgi:hypothetical protein
VDNRAQGGPWLCRNRGKLGAIADAGHRAPDGRRRLSEPALSTSQRLPPSVGCGYGTAGAAARTTRAGTDAPCCRSGCDLCHTGTESLLTVGRGLSLRHVPLAASSPAGDAHYRCASSTLSSRGRVGRCATAVLRWYIPRSTSVSRSGERDSGQGCAPEDMRSTTARLRICQLGTGCRGRGRVKSFFELLGKAMQSTGMTLRLCLLMLVAAYVISQLK